MTLLFDLPDAAATEALGARIAGAIPPGTTLHLRGDLGAGKTTLVRGFLHALGYGGVVKSPTYTLVEPYDTASGPVFHFDLYRLGDPEELEFMGIRDFFTPEARCLVEWPERGRGILPLADLVVTLVPAGGGRRATLTAETASGRTLLDRLGTG